MPALGIFVVGRVQRCGPMPTWRIAYKPHAAAHPPLILGVEADEHV
jgi:hypothetical protein